VEVVVARISFFRQMQRVPLGLQPGRSLAPQPSARPSSSRSARGLYSLCACVACGACVDFRSKGCAGAVQHCYQQEQTRLISAIFL